MVNEHVGLIRYAGKEFAIKRINLHSSAVKRRFSSLTEVLKEADLLLDVHGGKNKDILELLDIFVSSFELL